jgi:hypothetical protein
VGSFESREVGLVEDDGVWRGLVHVKVDLVIVEEASLRSRLGARLGVACPFVKNSPPLPSACAKFCCSDKMAASSRGMPVDAAVFLFVLFLLNV